MIQQPFVVPIEDLTDSDEEENARVADEECIVAEAAVWIPG